MVDWFIKLSNAERIAVAAIVVTVGLAAFKGLFALCKWLFGKKDGPAPQGAIIALPIDPNNVLDRYEITLKQLGQSEEKIKNQQEIIRKIEKQAYGNSAKSTDHIESVRPQDVGPFHRADRGDGRTDRSSCCRAGAAAHTHPPVLRYSRTPRG